GLGLRLHDMVYDSRLFPIWEQWYNYAQQNYIGPIADGAPEWIAFYRDPIRGFDHRPNIAVSWLWWGFFLLPLDRQQVGSFQEAIKKHFLVRQGDGSAFIQLAPGANVDDVPLTLRALTLAHQLGDARTAGALRAHVEANYEPTWDRQVGEFFYG